MSLSKILEIVVAEIIEAFVFILLIIINELFNSQLGLTSFLTDYFLLLWGVLGIATPFVIWFELTDEFKKLI